MFFLYAILVNFMINTSLTPYKKNKQKSFYFCISEIDAYMDEVAFYQNHSQIQIIYA